MVFPHISQLYLLLLLAMLLLGGCSSQVYHVVERGETMYSIGWIYGYEYRDIARWNKISAPYALNAGQRLLVSPPRGDKADSIEDQTALVVEQGQDRKRGTEFASDKGQPAASKTPSRGNSATNKKPVGRVVNADREALAPVRQWRWPTTEKRILSTFARGNPSRQGLGIAGEQGSPVVAAANGRVVYAGSGLPRYGRLIILKHNETFLSAYAHNHKLRVREGEVVSAGQRIADMGSSGTDRTRLYFEIRRNGKPVDPLQYLPR